MSNSDAATQSLGSKGRLAVIQSLLIALLIGAWLLPQNALGQPTAVTFELADTAAVPGGIAVVPFVFSGNNFAVFISGQILFPDSLLEIRTLDWCIPEDLDSQCEELTIGLIDFDAFNPESDPLEDFTSYLVFDVNPDANTGPLEVLWDNLNAEPSSPIVSEDSTVSILDSSSLQISTFPSALDFGEVEVFTEAFAEIEICGFNAQAGPVWVVDIQADDENFSLEPDQGTCPEDYPFDLAEQPGGCCTREVRFAPDGETTFLSQLEILASTGLELVTLTGEGVPDGDFLPSLDPESHDFGTIETNAPAAHTFQVINDGDQAGEIISVSIEDAVQDNVAFSIIGGSCVIASPPVIVPPGDDCSIDIQVLASGLLTEPTDFSAELVVETEAGSLSAPMTVTGLTSDPIFDDFFELGGGDFGCVIDNWDAAINLDNDDAGTPADGNRRYSGPCGLRVPLDTLPRYLEDLRPSVEPFYRVRFYAYFDDIESGGVRFFEAFGDEMARVQIVYENGGLEFSAFDNDNNLFREIISNIGSGWHSIEIVWEADANAAIALSVNGSDDVIIEVDNALHRIDGVRLGNLQPDLLGVGSVDFDAFDSRRISRPGRLLVGDANDDGEVDVADLFAISLELGQTPFAVSFASGQPDCNEDGVVDNQDRECIGEIIADGELLEFALDDIDASPGADIELPAWLFENPFDASSLVVQIEIDTDLLTFRTDGTISCGAVSAGENLGGEHDLGCKEFSSGLTVSVSGSTPLPVGELFRARLSVDPFASDGDEAFANIVSPEFSKSRPDLTPSGVSLPSTMFNTTDGGVFIIQGDSFLLLDPQSHDFGTIATNTSAVLSFEVFNKGGGAGQINDIFIAGDAEFSIIDDTCLASPPPVLLNPGDSCDILVEFSVPGVLLEPVDYSAELIVDTEEGNLTASLSGTAETIDPIFSDRFEVEFLPMPPGFMMPRGKFGVECGLFLWNIREGLINADTGRQGTENRRYSGECGLRVPVDGEPRYIGDLSPNQEASYKARFYAFFDDVESGAVLFFEAADDEAARMQLTYVDGGLVFSVFDNNGDESFEVIPDLGVGWHSLEVAWESGTNAEVRLSVNGTADVIIEVDNSNHRIDEIYLGNLDPDLEGIGSIDIDAFDSRRVTRPGRLLVGDANDDGVVDIADLRDVDREISPSLPFFASGQPDCNEDGFIDSEDLECLGAIVVGDEPIEFALADVTAMPGESIELSGLLADNPFDITSLSAVIMIDNAFLSYGTSGISCGRVVRGEALTELHTLICGTSGDDVTIVAVTGTAVPLPEGELFRLLLDVNPDANLGEESLVFIEEVEIDLAGLLAPSTMYRLTDGLVRTPEPIPSLVLDPLAHDFGEVDPADFPVGRDFALTNVGDPGSFGDVASVNLVGNAAFTLAADDCSDRSLDAGESCTVTVLFDAAELQPGKYATALEFAASPPVAPALIAGTRAGIIDFDILPANADFGIVTVGDGPVTRILELINIGELPLDLADVSFEIGGSAAFAIAANNCAPGLSLNPGQLCTIELEFLGGDQAPGSYIGFFQASSDTSSVSVNLFGETEALPPVAALSVDPTTHDFGQLGVSDFPVTQNFTVFNSGEPGSVATISSIALSGSPLFALIANNCAGAELAAGQSCTLTVAFDASDAAPGNYSASIQVLSDAGSAVIPLSGTRIPSEINLSVTPLSHNFGTLALDDLPATQTFTVLATGDPGLDVAITGISLSDDDAFAITEDTCSGAELSATQSCQVTVSFNPSALKPGQYAASLEIVSEQPLVVAISGQLAVIAPQPDLFVLPAPDNPRPGVAGFVGELSASGVGNAVTSAGRIGMAATTRFLVSAPAEGAVYLVADGNFDAPAQGIGSNPDTIRFQVSGPSPFGISQAGNGDFRASGHSAIALGDSLGGRVVLLFGSSDTLQGAASIDLSEVTGGGAELDAGFQASVVSGSELVNQRFELAFVGDFNGNGHDDLAIGLPDYGSAGQGRVYVLFGNDNDSNINLDALEPDQGIIIDGTTAEGALGFSIAGAGDFNGSGFADLVIGAPFGSDYGRVVVVFGSDEPVNLSVSALDGNNGFVARMPVESSAGPRFGYSVAAAGDFDGDGFADIIVGAPRSMIADQPSAPGQARILFGRASVGTDDVLVDDHDQLRQLAINPFSIGNNSLFGFSVAGLGDSSRNGFSDVAIGDPGYGDPVNNPALPRFTGQAYTVFGQADPPPALVAEELGSDQATVYRPQQPSVRAGWAVAGIGDFSGDGFPDLLVTAPNASTPQFSNAGQVWAVGGRETALDIEPVIEAIDPATGLVTGGQTVTIFGRHFLEGVEVWFGDQPCLDVERVDHSELRCLTPPTDASITDVSVVNPDGTGATLEQAFRFLDPTTLELTAAAFPGQFGQSGRLAEFEVFNSGDFAAEQLTLTISTGSTEILDWFSLAPQCTVEGQIAICDFSEVAPWQCSVSDNQATCMLGQLPAEGRAAVMLDFGGSGPVPTSLDLSSINADGIETDAELFGDNQ